MTSGNFSYVPLDSVWVDRENRQRKDLDPQKIKELAESIRDRGLIHPPVIDRETHQLLTGERRYEAHRLLGYDQICVQYADELNDEERHLLELEENIKRLDLTWQEEADAIARFHDLKSSTEEDWSQSRTADHLGMAQSSVAKYLMVKKAMDEGIEEVIEAPKLSTAANFAQRRLERQKSSAMRDLTIESASPSGESSSPSGESSIPIPDRFADIQEANFKAWAKKPLDNPFNFIHCDFPYGVNAGDTKGQSAARSTGGYEDKPEIYFELLDKLIERQDNFISPSAHMLFWFSMDYYNETLLKLRAGGWKVNHFPLIWYKSDNTGIIPDANRGPRRVYETAFLCTRGDRKIVKARANCVGAATTKQYHMSEKSAVMLEHFMRMLVDESTRMLDPTCGSGNAVKVAEQLGAQYSLGLEMNPEYVLRARENLELD